MRVRIGRGGGERWSLTLILLLAALLRLWRVGEHGYGNLYYAAGVRSMLLGGRNLFFGAFDPAGFVSVDKPPVAFWLQAASAWLLGFSGRSLMLPQALGGVVAVAVVYHVTRHAWGPGAALLAALTLAITPIAVDRVNSTDSLLVLVLVLAAWPALRAVETGRLCPLLTAMALVGVAFNVKMLAAYVVLPAFVLLYLLAAPVPWCRRLGHLAVAGGVLVIVSLSWSLAVDLTPPSARPYVGDSHNNTEMNLIFGYNGIARLVAGRRWALSGRRGPWADGGPRMTAPPDGVAVPSGAGVPTAPATTASGVGTGALGGTVGTAAGPPAAVASAAESRGRYA